VPATLVILAICSNPAGILTHIAARAHPGTPILVNIDTRIIEYLSDLHGQFPLLDSFFIILADYSFYLFAAIFAATLAYLLYAAYRSSTIKGLYCLLLFPAAILINLILRELIGRERPFTTIEEFNSLIYHSPGDSFPSNHAAASAAIAATVFLVNKPLGVLCFVAVFLVSISRTYVGVHYLSDVLAGIAVALLVFILIYLLRGRLKEILSALQRRLLALLKT